MVSSSVRTRPAISILTPTWQRGIELFNLIDNIHTQEYDGRIEHVIVSDGRDPNLKQHLKNIYPQYMNLDEINPYDRYIIKFVECGINWSTFLPDSFSAIPLMTATALATNQYHMWLADDERMLVPNHISKLVDLLEKEDTDFAYSKVKMTLAWQPDAQPYIIGEPIPRYGQMTHCIYNIRVLKLGMYRPFVGSAGDWDVIQRWILAGAKYSFLNEVTLSHKADK